MSVFIIRKETMFKRLLPILIVLFILSSTPALADEGYVSPESYAVNEADLIDYIDVPPPARPDIDNLDKPVKIKKQKEKKVREEKPKPYKRGPVYHMAKWWTDARYKREEPHHGTKHEIKVKQRMEYEKQLLEKQEENQTSPEE